MCSHHDVYHHFFQVNSLSFNPFNEWILATASGDGTIKLFDLRKLSRSLHAFDNHEYVYFVSSSYLFAAVSSSLLFIETTLSMFLIGQSTCYSSVLLLCCDASDVVVLRNLHVQGRGFPG